MLKKIRVDQVRLGMHLHELVGAWLEHPFWKMRFVLRDPADLAKLRASGVKECWIDTAKGLDVLADAPAAASADAAPARPRGPEPDAEPRPSAPKPPPPATASLEAEVERAAALCSASREVVMSLFGEARMGKALDVQSCLPLVDEIASSVWRNPGAFTSMARLKTHDDYTYMHSVAVCALMVSLARQLGMDEAEAREAGMAGLLHDMGKAVMPLEVLNKPGKLTTEEYAVMKTHPERGHDMLKEGTAPVAMALDVCLHHHERPDGMGYPHGLAGALLSRPARMGAVCDVYDAITSNRPYKAGWDPAESIARMAAWSKAGQFDDHIFQLFVRSLGIYPNGSLVRLRSGRLAVVIEQNEKSLMSPRVKVFFNALTQMPMPPEMLDLSDPRSDDAITARESNREWKFPHLDELWAGADNLRTLRK
jgi:putative nucleotidyltransferase with HDIG domain